MHERQYPIRVGYLSSFAPFRRQGPDGPEGLVVDRLDECFALLDLEVEWLPTSLDQQLDRLTGGQLELVAAMGITDERRRVVSFTRPLIETGGALFSLHGRVEPDDATIVTPATGPLVESVREVFPDSELVLVDGYDQALTAVLDGVAHAAALNLHVGIELAERVHRGRFRLPDRAFHEVKLAAAFVPGRSDDLGRRLDDVIARGTAAD